MIWNWFYFGVLYASSLLISSSLLPNTLNAKQFSFLQGKPNELHRRQKRQIGVLARTGTLPQGKRSLETSACTREPFVRDNDMENSRVDILDSFIQEPKKSKSFSFLKSPAEKLDEQRNSSELLKHFIETFAGDEQLQERRLVKDQDKLRRFKGLSQKVPCSYFDLRKSCYLLAETEPPIIFEYSDKSGIKRTKYLSSEIAKKNVDLNRIFSLLDYNDKKFDQLKKKNLASLAKSDGFFSLKYPLLKEQNWCNIYNFLDLKEYDDRNKYKGKWQNLGKRGTSRAELFEKWKLLCNNKNTKETNFLSKDDELRKKRSPYFEWSPGYSVFFSSDVLKPGYSSGELKSEENLFKKRFLGRIPQLGRTHQKVQSPSSRRRPHLRPNWL